MFFGYNSESNMRQANPNIADELIKIASQKEITVCSRNKKCTGSLDGKEYCYEDGSKDLGEKTIIHTAKINGHTFSW